MSRDYKIEICSPPDRENLVAFIWFEQEEWIEINQETEELQIEIYPREDGEPWRVGYDTILKALAEAKHRLVGR